jgi:antitoxin component of RelBE/YafQ-DinJ toxin-antitoxin module
MEMTQMNTRIERQLKDDGDAVFAGFGYSPSQVVRLVWSWAIQHRHEPESVQDFLRKADQSKRAKEDELRQERLRKARDFQESVEALYGQLGLATNRESSYAHLPYKEVRDLMYEEKLESGTA